jgi:hypothetical protein
VGVKFLIYLRDLGDNKLLKVAVSNYFVLYF